MKPFRLSDAVPSDLQAAYNYYAKRSERAADHFVAAYLEARDRLIANPLLCRVRPHGWRQAMVPRFPLYAIFYKEKADFWLIGAIVSTARDPDDLLASLLIREVTDAPE